MERPSGTVAKQKPDDFPSRYDCYLLLIPTLPLGAAIAAWIGSFSALLSVTIGSALSAFVIGLALAHHPS